MKTKKVFNHSLIAFFVVAMTLAFVPMTKFSIKNIYANSSIVCPTAQCTGTYENGKCSGCQNQFVASIGETGFDDLATALSQAVSGDEVICYVDCSQDLTIPQGVKLLGRQVTFSGFVTNNGTIDGGVYTKESSGATEEEEAFPGFGQLGGETPKFGVTNNGTILNGQFPSRLENNGIIENGIFNNDLTNNQNAQILGGIYYGTLTNYGIFAGGTTINNFDNHGTINAGSIASVINHQDGIINGGDFAYSIRNNGVLNNLNVGDLTMDWNYAIENYGQINCTAHIRKSQSKDYVCDCRVCGLTQHISTTDEYVSPTCSRTGLTQGAHCSICQEVLIAQEIVPALGRDVAEEFHVNENKDRRCDDCGYKFKLPTYAVVLIVLGSVIGAGCVGFAIFYFIRKWKILKVKS